MTLRASLAALAIVALAPPPAAAIPAFARRYKTACTTCHSLPPQLNPFGQAFRSNGYRLPAGEQRRQADDVALGAPEWEGLFPRAFLSGNVDDPAPFAGFLRTALEREANGSTGVEVLAELLAAGNLGKHASFFFSGGFTQKGTFIFRAIAQVDQLAGPWLNVRAGQMEPALVAFSRQTHLLSYTPYLAFNQAARGIELGATRPALEVYGAGSDPGILRGLRYAAGVSELRGSAAEVYGRASYKFGGVAAAGDRAGQAGRPIAPLAETSLQVGAFTYRVGKPGSFGSVRATRTGADVTFLFRELELDAAGWVGTDDGATASSWALLTQASVRPWPWLMVIGRYEALWAAGQPAERRAVFAARGALQQNVAVTLESEIELPDGDVGAIAGLFLAF